MKRAFENLVSNGVRYGESVEITLTSDDRGATVRIMDNGDGIPPADRERMLRPFQRMDNSRSRETGGTGLGLAVVDRVLKRHGGWVSFDHDAHGRFVVEVWIPR